MLYFSRKTAQVKQNPQTPRNTQTPKNPHPPHPKQKFSGSRCPFNLNVASPISTLPPPILQDQAMSEIGKFHGIGNFPDRAISRINQFTDRAISRIK
jgi:hypothetical protein